MCVCVCESNLPFNNSYILNVNKNCISYSEVWINLEELLAPSYGKQLANETTTKMSTPCKIRNTVVSVHIVK